MKTSERKLSSSPKLSTTVTSQTNGSHVVTLVRNPGRPDYPRIENEVLNSSEYHLTARITNKQLSRRELSLLLEVLEYQIVHFGVNFPMMLALSEFYSVLLGNKRNSHEINDGKIRTVVTVAEILLKSLRDIEYSLSSEELIQLPNHWKELLSPYLMSKRTYGSRFRTWRPEKFIRVRAVPVSALTEREPGNKSKRYSGYTKGYGESHGNAHRKKTKPSTELDGEQETTGSEERNLIHRVSDPEHQPANSLWIKFKNLLGINR